MITRLFSNAKDEDTAQVLAAVDLGSNSFHMVVARYSHGQLTVIDRLREMVRLADGLDDQNDLTRESRDRALECLARFGQRLSEMHADSVRVAGTNTLRKARNGPGFLEEAAEVLGHRVELISGIEEARLVYLGAWHSLPAPEGRQLIIDIGGGSTEIVSGTGMNPDRLESLYIGCVSISREFFPSGKITARRFEKARLATRLELRPVKTEFRRLDLHRAVGTSGTIRAAQDVLMALELSDGGITSGALEDLINRMISVGQVSRIDLPGLNQHRAPVFPGGITILVEVMRTLGLEEMTVSEGALREGLLYDMLGRLEREDARARTVRSMERRFSVDEGQASRVERTSLALLDQVADSWNMETTQDRQMLAWAARLHEAGLDIAHSHYHRHGAYLLAHADMPGFPRNEQRVISCIVEQHRRRLDPGLFQVLPQAWHRRALRMTVLLRLAVLLHRSRADLAEPDLRLKASGRKLELRVDEEWLDGNPLTLADLEREQAYLQSAGFRLRIVSNSDPG